MSGFNKAAASALAGIAALTGYCYARLKRSLPVTGGEIRLEGLTAPVDVTFDTAGVPHIKAATDEDGLKALGYIVAQDRLLQMEMIKRTASGTLSEVIGFMGIDIDRFMRTIGLFRLAREYLSNVNDDSRRLIQAYIDGINCYISRERSRLPLEFALLGGRPEPWKPEDAFTVGIFLMWMLDASWLADLMREKLLRKLGPRLAGKLLPDGSGACRPACVVDGGGCRVETLQPGEEIDWGFDTEPAGGRWLGWGLRPRVLSGSNNWVVSGSRTTTGKPILASDPHIEHMVPSTLYLLHLDTPGFKVIGAGFVGIPIVGIGHNERCAWGVTSFGPDLIDLYVETFESESSDRYLFKGEWLDPETHIEEIKVRFLGRRSLKVVKTVHGPVIKRKGNRGLALKWTGQDTRFDLLKPFLDMNSAANWEEFRGALKDYPGPAFNFVYADVDGNIGYQGAAKVPVRARGDGTIPCPGKDGDCEWTGYIPFEEMPTAFNPERGWLATANNKVVSEGYPHLITGCWEGPYRQARISELLEEKEKLSVEDMKRIQGDVFTFTGRTYATAVAEAARGRDLPPRVSEAVGRLDEWDHNARADSSAMTIYFFGWRSLTELLLGHRLGDALYREYSLSFLNMRLAVEGILEERDEYWLPSGFRDYEELLIASVEKGMEEITRIYGTADQSRWEWGRVHTLTAFHLLGLIWPLNRILNVGPVPRDGEAETVNNALPESDPTTQLLARGSMGGSTRLMILPDADSHATYAGPLCRFIADLSDWDRSLMVLDVGQSGHRLSRHYKDHFARWLAVDYFPLPYSEGKIEECMESRLRMAPS